MKKIIYLWMFFLLLAKSYAQEPPAAFDVYHGENKHSISLEHTAYDFFTPVFMGVIYKANKIKDSFDVIDTNNGYPKFRLSSKNLEVDGFGKEKISISSLSAQKGEVVSLSIREKKSKKVMNLFFRLNRRWYLDDEIKLKNIEFKKGNYFFDLCKTIEKYTYSERIKSLTNDYSYHSKYITDKDIKDHKISIKKLNKLLKKYNCK